MDASPHACSSQPQAVPHAHGRPPALSWNDAGSRGLQGQGYQTPLSVANSGIKRLQEATPEEGTRRKNPAFQNIQTNIQVTNTNVAVNLEMEAMIAQQKLTFLETRQQDAQAFRVKGFCVGELCRVTPFFCDLQGRHTADTPGPRVQSA